MNISTTVVIFLATVIFARVCFERKDLLSWLFAYISATLSEIFRLFSQEQYDTFEIISYTFSALSVLLFIIAVSYEYYQTFSKTNKLKVIPITFLITAQQLTTLLLQITVAILLIIALFLIIRIYLKKRTPTHAFMCFIMVTGLMQLIASIYRDVGYPRANEFLEFSRIVMATMMLITGIIAIIEERIVRSEKKYRLAYNTAEFYKDLFIHDINNILQNLEFSLEILSQQFEEDKNGKKIKEIIEIAKNQVNRGADLSLNVKKLSDMESGIIQNKEIELIKIIKEIINYIELKFPEKNLTINLELLQDTNIVIANDLIVDIFRIILNNAIRYNNSLNTEILIKVSKELINSVYYVKIEFIDNGIGIPDSLKKDILQYVYKDLKSFKRIGLGLLLVNEVIRSFKGKIWIEDKVKGDYSQGSNVIIFIPQAHM
ncbi:hypothetical protein LCGC14_0954470 [marine sediment metagenome]|uniref:histidine kinase n=1 Tax=marine sediment metagenome TaxID=412755 RepID=A0A0F9NG92_9ZZZZ|nr:HAMP domain-containing histidine kinase [archaeon]